MAECFYFVPSRQKAVKQWAARWIQIWCPQTAPFANTGKRRQHFSQLLAESVSGCIFHYSGNAEVCCGPFSYFLSFCPPLPLPSPSPSPFSVLFSKNWLLEVYMADGWGNVKYFVAIVLVALSINVASSLQPKSSGGTHKKMFPIDTHRSICRSQLSWNVHPHPISISN